VQVAVLEPVLEQLVSDVTCRQQVFFAGFYHTPSSLGQLILFTLFPNQVQLLIQDLRAVSSSQVPPPLFTVSVPLLTRFTGLCRRFGKPRPLVTVRHLYRKKLALPLLPLCFTTLLSTSVRRHIASKARATKAFAVHFTWQRAAGMQAILYFKGMLFATTRISIVRRGRCSSTRTDKHEYRFKCECRVTHAHGHHTSH
jgi:hypothetical protein